MHSKRNLYYYEFVMVARKSRDQNIFWNVLIAIGYNLKSILQKLLK